MILGRADEIRNGKALGWAYDSDVPGAHLSISIRRGRDIIATGISNVFREDLPAAGVGNGDHAFEIPLPPNITSFQGLVITAGSEQSGEAVLAVATNDERHLDDLFQIFSARYDKALNELKRDIDGFQQDERSLDVLDEMGSQLKRLEKRMQELEVFIVRLDETSRSLQQRVGLGRKKGFFARIFGR